MNPVTILIILTLISISFFKPMVAQDETSAQQSSFTDQNPRSCSIFRYYGKNDLSINDIIVKSEETDVVCVKARFSLAIKVEEAVDAVKPPDGSIIDKKQENSTDTSERILLGYLPLDSVVKVEDSCPTSKLESNDPKNDKEETTTAANTSVENIEGPEQEMIVTFECGKLAFTFKLENNSVHVSSIKGVVNLDSTIAREFISDEPVFFTSDLEHHYKYDNLVEVTSKAKTKAFILSANFYHTEFEVFRTSTSSDFVYPPDENSKPF